MLCAYIYMLRLEARAQLWRFWRLYYCWLSLPPPSPHIERITIFNAEKLCALGDASRFTYTMPQRVLYVCIRNGPQLKYNKRKAFCAHHTYPRKYAYRNNCTRCALSTYTHTHTCSTITSWLLLLLLIFRKTCVNCIQPSDQVVGHDALMICERL